MDSSHVKYCQSCGIRKMRWTFEMKEGESPYCGMCRRKRREREERHRVAREQKENEQRVAEETRERRLRLAREFLDLTSKERNARRAAGDMPWQRADW